MPPSEIRKDAREALKGKWGKAICFILAYFLISIIEGIILNFFDADSMIYQILDLAFAIIALPLSFGFTISFIKLKRGESVSAFDFIKEGLSRFGKAWGIFFHTLLRVWLPILCLIVIVAVMIWTVGLSLLSELKFNTPASIIITVLFIACIVYIIARTLLYALAYYISYDNPSLSSKECVIKSAKCMVGNRGSLVLLVLSFIGWAILCIFTFGIGLLWLAPYIEVAEICFYERIVKNSSKKIESSAEIEE